MPEDNDKFLQVFSGMLIGILLFYLAFWSWYTGAIFEFLGFSTSQALALQPTMSGFIAIVFIISLWRHYSRISISILITDVILGILYIVVSMFANS